MSSPSATVSIAILNYQRCDALRRALHAARNQRGAVEILAVDNASTDGSVEMVRREFPDVRVVALPANVGTAARNAGVHAAKGDVVVTLDNDVLLEGVDALDGILAAFERHPRAAVVDFAVLGPDGALSRRDWCHPWDPERWADRELATCVVLEGASACRREEFLALGGYWPPFFIGHEGWDLALRAIAAGREVVYTPTVRVRHLVEASVRPSERIYYTFVRNAIWVAVRNYPRWRALTSIAQDLALVGFCAARAGHLRAWACGLRDAVHGLPLARATRAPLDGAACGRLDAIRRHRPRLVARIRRHLRQRLI